MTTDCYKFWEMVFSAPAIIAFVTGTITLLGSFVSSWWLIKRDREKQHIENTYSFNRATYELKRICYLKFYDFIRTIGKEPQININDDR